MSCAGPKRLGSPSGAEAKKVRESEFVGSTTAVVPISLHQGSATRNVSASAGADKLKETQVSDDAYRSVTDVSGDLNVSSMDDVEPSDEDTEVIAEQGELWVTKTAKAKVGTKEPKQTKKIGTPMGLVDRTVYMAGRGGYKLARDAALKKATAFKAELVALIGATESITLCGDSIRVVCQSIEQAAKLLKTEMILGKEIVVTKPNSHARRLEAVKPAAKKWNKGVIKRVPLFLTDAEMKDELGAVWVHRIDSVKQGKKTPTRAVIIATECELPSTVTLGLMAFKVHTYVPKPLRCAKCQKFGHKAVHCKSGSVKCVKCGGDHAYTQCSTEVRKCVNCGLEHSSAYKGCAKYRMINKTLILAANTHVEYSAAAKTLATNERSYKSALTGHRDPTTSAVSMVLRPVSTGNDAVVITPVPKPNNKEPNRGNRRQSEALKKAQLQTRETPKNSNSQACPSTSTSQVTKANAVHKDAETQTERKDEETQTSTELTSAEGMLQRLIVSMLWLTKNMSMSNRSEAFVTQQAQMVTLLNSVGESTGLFARCAATRQRRNSLPENSISSATVKSQSAPA